MFREANRPYFSAAEVQFVCSIAGLIADGQLLGEVEAGSDEAGLLVLDAADGVTMANQAARHWLDQLDIGPRSGAAAAGDAGRRAPGPPARPSWRR